jgi:thioredoxin 1
MTQIVTDNNFSTEVLESELPVLVDFWAPWCGPCRMIAPLLDELSNTYEGKMKIVKVNVDECPQTATSFAIRSIPSLLVFKNGENVETQMGALPKGALISLIEKNL